MRTSRDNELANETAPAKRDGYVVTGALQSNFHREAVIARQASGRRRAESISKGHNPSGSSVVCSPMDFPDETGLHVENKTPHRNFFGDPRM